MKFRLKFCGALVIASAVACTGFAQRPRTVSSNSADQTSTDDQAPATPTPAAIRVKYEGGFLGYNKKEDGTLSFDDVNQRLVFRDKLNKERISLPYSSINAAYGDTKSLQPAAATVASNIPSIYALPARFIKKKYQYLTLQFNDPDNNVSGLTSFKVENKEVLHSELTALAQKSVLSPRGDGYVRRQPAQTQTVAMNTSMQTINGGLLNGKAVALPRPAYPQAARDAKEQGTVSVQVTIDENGNVIEATPISGPDSLQEAAVDAARRAKFTPTKLNGQPVRVIGTITYNFVL